MAERIEFVPPTTVAECQTRLAETEEAIAACRAKLERAKAERISTGEYADADWFARCKAALRFKGMEHQRLQRCMGELRRIERQVEAVRFEQHFIDIARGSLPAEQFANLTARARARACIA